MALLRRTASRRQPPRSIGQRFKFSLSLDNLGDTRLLFLVYGFLIFGALMIYSGSAIIADGEGKSTFHYFLLQLVWIALGSVGMFVLSRVPLKWVHRGSVIGLVVSIFLLVLVLFIGKTVEGARRWIDLGPFDLQPSEIAKLMFVIYLSAWLSRKRATVKNITEAFKLHFYNDLFPFLLLMAIICFLILLQPDLDTAVIIALTALVVYFVSGQDALHNLGVIFILITIVIVGLGAAFAASYRVERINTYVKFITTGELDDDTRREGGFQLWNGLLALGSGGVFGRGFGESRQKLYYLNKAAFTDSIFAVIGEEFGLFGSVALIIAFLYFMSLGVNSAQRAPDKFSALLAIGITTWITIQAFLNLGANMALIPFGGIPLPFISYGGSNTLMVMAGVGLLLNVSRRKA